MSEQVIESKAIVRHTLTVYNALKDRAKEEGNDLIFRGKVTEVFASTGVSQGYYSDVFKQLEGQECILYLQKGSRSTDSVILISHPPTPEAHRERPKSDLTNPERYANLQEDVEALKTLVGGVSLVDALITIESRLKALEESQGP